MSENQLKYRTPGFIKLYNKISSPNLKSYFDFDELIKKAKSKTGIHSFGPDFWDEPLRVLLKSVVHEANLSPFGAFIFREKIRGQLINRLRADDWFRRKSELLEQDLLPVYLITGLQRTGTTRLQRLLSHQPSSRGLLTWEALNPSPIKSLDETKKRIAQGKLAAKSIKWMAPDFNSIHPIHPQDFEEDVLLLDVTFQSTAFEAILNVPSYSEWLTKNYNASPYEYEVKLLKLLQYGSDKKHWILKSPHHLEYLDLFKKVLKPEKIIWTHRDIQKTVPSLLSMLFYSRGLFQNTSNLEEVSKHWFNKMKVMVEKGIAFNELNPQHVLHLDYKKWTTNEKETVSNILGLEQSDVLSESVHYTSKHSYNLEYFNVTEEEINTQFSSYINFSKALKFN